MTYTRICPQCHQEIKHKNEISWKKSIKENKICFSCTRKNYCNSEEGKKKMIANLGEPKFGKDNPFYGKKHTKAVRKYLAKVCPKVGADNGMNGRSTYDVWVEKYGLEEANKRDIARKKKWSKSLSGKNNPMYGKPSPQGSGNGWSGWYKGWYFRSLRELSYVINYLEKNNMTWVSAEKKRFRIPYKDWDGRDRTYHPDFFVENKKIVEIKPNKLKQSATNRSKKEAAESFCEENGYQYEIVEPIRMKDEQIVNLYNEGLITFIKRYEDKFKERFIDGKKQKN